MRILYYEPFSGISGDMHLAALVDLGVPLDYLRMELSKLGLPGWNLRLEPASKMGIHGTRADVDLTAKPSLLRSHQASQHHEHRNFRDIRAIIESSTLGPAVQKLSLDIFQRVAQAEAKVHSLPIDEVGFHEVGAVDSIIDIVGGAICIDWFKPDLIIATPPELGGGFVNCAHGRLPVPAPATVEILAGIPSSRGAVPFEMTTPTGAAILAVVVNRFSTTERLTIQKTAYGIGHRDVQIPNVLRVSLAESNAAALSLAELGDCSSATVIECNIDDMTGEALGALLPSLMAAGASDAWFTPIIMKKSRPAFTLAVLCASPDCAKFAELIIRETSSFGLRYQSLEKLALRRDTEIFQSSLGPVPIKKAWLGDRVIKAKPEFEDCRAIAESAGLAVRQVINIIQGELDAQR